MASVLHAYPDLDANHSVKWRPFLLLFSSWTPPKLPTGVQSTLLSSFGRHLPDYMASSLSVLSNLDAIRTITRRPILLTFSSWTPLNSGDGVRSAQLIQSGRLPLNHMASVLHAYLDLDAIRTITRRPFCSASPIWTPHTQSHGVQFCCSSQVGRHPLNHTASIQHIFSNLDASSVNMWRPIYAFIAIWTPCNI